MLLIDSFIAAVKHIYHILRIIPEVNGTKTSLAVIGTLT